MENVQYITDVEGHKTAVIVPIGDYEGMLEDLHFGEIARESKDEPKRDFNEFSEEISNDEKIAVDNRDIIALQIFLSHQLISSVLDKCLEKLDIPKDGLEFLKSLYKHLG